MFGFLTVREHVELFMRILGVKYTKRAIEEFCKMFQLEDYQKTQAENLSEGNKRKLQFALSLIKPADILFLDEPTAGMDPETK